MAGPSVTNTFSNSTTADATQVNTNFTDLINGATDGTKDYSINALTVAGTATLNGNVTLGNASGDDITHTGSLASSLPVKTTFSYDLGSSTIGWKSIYFGSNDSAARTVRVIAGVLAASYTLTLPVDGGSSGQVLTTAGSGTTSWSTMGVATSFTPTFNGFGTVASVGCWYQQFGKAVRIYGTFTAGTPSATTGSIDVSGTFTIDSTKYPNTAKQRLGTFTEVRTAVGPSASPPWDVFYDGSDTAKVYIAFQTGSNVFSKSAGNNLLVAGDVGSFDFWISVT
jgi:hypothetical protein